MGLCFLNNMPEEGIQGSVGGWPWVPKHRSHFDRLVIIIRTMSEIENIADRPLAAQPEIEVTAEAIVEALLFSTDAPLGGSKIVELIGTGDVRDVRRHVETLNKRYEESGAAFRIEAIAKGYQMLTLPVYHRWVGKLHKARSESRLSPAALESLAIVAYRQPVLRAQIEAIRGVAVGEILARLREMNLIRIVGRAEEIGRPLLYGTTKKFLELLGLEKIEDLPKLDEDNPQAIPKLKVAE